MKELREFIEAFRATAQTRDGLCTDADTRMWIAWAEARPRHLEARAFHLPRPIGCLTDPPPDRKKAAPPYWSGWYVDDASAPARHPGLHPVLPLACATRPT